jgi:hypothetical protein
MKSENQRRCKPGRTTIQFLADWPYVVMHGVCARAATTDKDVVGFTLVQRNARKAKGNLFELSVEFEDGHSNSKAQFLDLMTLMALGSEEQAITPTDEVPVN